MLGAGQNNEIGRLQLRRAAHKAQRNAALGGQGIDIVMIRHARIGNHGDLQAIRRCLRTRCGLAIGRIFLGQIEIEPGDHAGQRLAALTRQPVKRILQQLRRTAKTIDQQRLHTCPLGRRKDIQRTLQCREHTAAMNIANQPDRQIGRLGKAHIGDVACTQIRLRRRTRPLNDHHVICRPQPRKGFEHGIEQCNAILPEAPGL